MRAFTIKIAVFALLMTTSCSNDDGPKPSCFQDENRRVVKTIKEVEGTILGSRCDGKTFVIEPDKKMEINPMGILHPCNLTEGFQVDGAKIVFSGYIYESFENEDICANFFEITDIRLANP